MKRICPRRKCALWLASLVAALGCGADSGAWSRAPGVLHTDQRVGIGTNAPASELAVKGTVLAQEVKVSVDGWPDYVFHESYPLMPLDELAQRVERDGHLPGMPDAASVAREGLDLGASQRKLLEKVEELTLYVIELERANAGLAARVDELERRAPQR
jgi:hypothetical protein